MLFNGLAALLGARVQKRPRCLGDLFSPRNNAENVPVNGLEGNGIEGSLAKQSRRELPDAAVMLPTQSYTNPLYETTVEDEEDWEEDEEVEVMESYMEGTVYAAFPSTPHLLVPSSADNAFPEFTTPTSNGSLVNSLMFQATSTSGLCALVSLERLQMHPVSADDFSTVDFTLAGLLVLCNRGAIQADELSPELILTLLALLEITCSQYRTLDSCLRSYLRRHPDRCILEESYRSCLPDLQAQVLDRCQWRVLLRDRDEVFAALADIGCHPDFERLCAFVRDCAAFGVTPMGSHEHSPAAEAYGGAHTHALALSRAARGGSPQRRSQQAASASMGVSDAAATPAWHLEAAGWMAAIGGRMRTGRRRQWQSAHVVQAWHWALAISTCSQQPSTLTSDLPGERPEAPFCFAAPPVHHFQH